MHGHRQRKVTIFHEKQTHFLEDIWLIRNVVLCYRTMFASLSCGAWTC